MAEYDLTARCYVALGSIGDTRVEQGDDASIPTSLCLSEDGRSLYITLWQCGIGVHLYDVGDHCLRKPLVRPDAPGGSWPNCWTSAQAGNDLYVTLKHQTHWLPVDAAGGQITEMGASGKAICRSGRSLYVSTSNGIRRIRLWCVQIHHGNASGQRDYGEPARACPLVHSPHLSAGRGRSPIVGLRDFAVRCRISVRPALLDR